MSIAKITDGNVTFEDKALAHERRQPSPPAVSRRTMLRGVAAGVALPALDSLLSPSEARAQTKTPIRFVGWHIACGVWGPSWYPVDTGPAYALTPSLTPLAKVKDKVLVLSGLQNKPACDPTGSHGCGPPAMLTCRQGTKPAVTMGISVDQVYAQALGTATRIPSLQLSTTNKMSVDVGYPAVYNGTISWAGPTQPLSPVINPAQIFDKIFAGVPAAGGSTGTAAAAELAKRKALRTSVLDQGLAEAKSLQLKMGSTDRRKLDQYLTSVRAVEDQIQRTATPATAACVAGVKPAASVADLPTLTKIMLDLMVLAFQCDATRVITFQQSNGGFNSFQRFPWLNITEDHHGLSHHLNDPAKGAKLAAIDKWEVEQYAYFLEKMNAIDEGGTTMLDNSLVFLSSEISDGNRHNQDNKPILLAGSAGKKIATGRHAKYNADPQPDLFIALLNIMGVPATTFGLAGTKPLTGLTA